MEHSWCSECICLSACDVCVHTTMHECAVRTGRRSNASQPLLLADYMGLVNDNKEDPLNSLMVTYKTVKDTSGTAL